MIIEEISKTGRNFSAQAAMEKISETWEISNTPSPTHLTLYKTAYTHPCHQKSNTVAAACGPAPSSGASHSRSRPRSAGPTRKSIVRPGSSPTFSLEGARERRAADAGIRSRARQHLSGSASRGTRFVREPRALGSDNNRIRRNTVARRFQSKKIAWEQWKPDRAICSARHLHYSCRSSLATI